MGLLRSNLEIETWLAGAATSWRALPDAEFRQLFARWRARFEPVLSHEGPAIRGDRAMRELEARLPDDVYIFRAPGYAYLPASTSPRGATFGYAVTQLARVDRALLNAVDAILADAACSYTCLYTHEWKALAEPEFCWFQADSEPSDSRL